jgi:hypothetical protein
VSGLFDDLVEGGAEIVAALVEEVGGFDVAIDGGTGGEVEVGDDALGGMPVEEGGFDQVAVGVVADGAFAGMVVVLDAGGLRLEAGFGLEA